MARPMPEPAPVTAAMWEVGRLGIGGVPVGLALLQFQRLDEARGVREFARPGGPPKVRVPMGMRRNEAQCRRKNPAPRPRFPLRSIGAGQVQVNSFAIYACAGRLKGPRIK